MCHHEGVNNEEAESVTAASNIFISCLLLEQSFMHFKRKLMQRASHNTRKFLLMSTFSNILVIGSSGDAIVYASLNPTIPSQTKVITIYFETIRKPVAYKNSRNKLF